MRSPGLSWGAALSLVAVTFRSDMRWKSCCPFPDPYGVGALPRLLARLASHDHHLARAVARPWSATAASPVLAVRRSAVCPQARRHLLPRSFFIPLSGSRPTRAHRFATCHQKYELRARPPPCWQASGRPHSLADGPATRDHPPRLAGGVPSQMASEAGNEGIHVDSAEHAVTTVAGVGVRTCPSCRASVYQQHRALHDLWRDAGAGAVTSGSLAGGVKCVRSRANGM